MLHNYVKKITITIMIALSFGQSNTVLLTKMLVIYIWLLIITWKCQVSLCQVFVFIGTSSCCFPCRIHFAGTESATVWCGFLNGAVQSGYRAANEVGVYGHVDRLT